MRTRSSPRPGRVDGFLLCDVEVDDRRFDVLAEAGVPAVVAGHPVSPCPFPWVETRHAEGMRLVAEHLVALGHRAIGFVGGPADYEHVQARLGVWRETLLDAGVEPGPVAHAIGELFDGEVTAIVHTSDGLAAAALAAARGPRDRRSRRAVDHRLRRLAARGAVGAAGHQRARRLRRVRGGRRGGAAGVDRRRAAARVPGRPAGADRPRVDGAAAMSRIAVIGATGHVGTYLVPRLVRAGHEVVALSRGEREPTRRPSGARSSGWPPIARPRTRPARSARGSPPWAPTRSIDMICFTPDVGAAARRRAAARRAAAVHCGTIWVHGPAARVPITEDEPRTAYGEYGTGKAAIEALLPRETIAGGVPSVVLHPGAHRRPGWPVITPAGNLDLDVWRRLATGAPLAAARSRARRTAPRPRRRRRPGLRARADPAGRDRVELPRGRPSRR